MAGVVAIVIAAFWCVVAVLITWSRGYRPGSIALCLAGIVGGGLVAFLPGRYALTNWTVIAGMHLSADRHFTIIACCAILVGALAGLYVTERIRDHKTPSGHQVIMGALGFMVGGMAGYILVFLTHGSWASSLTAYVLFPATIATTTLAGSAIAHRPIEDPPG